MALAPGDSSPVSPLLIRRNSVTDWYGLDPTSYSNSIAAEAYQAAIQYFQSELTSSQFKSIDLKATQSINDVQKVVADAKKKYDDESKRKKIQKWLQKLSGQMMYYGSVLDTLAQHHPEYVALVWGAVKVVFIGVLN